MEKSTKKILKYVNENNIYNSNYCKLDDVLNKYNQVGNDYIQEFEKKEKAYYRLDLDNTTNLFQMIVNLFNKDRLISNRVGHFINQNKSLIKNNLEDLNIVTFGMNTIVEKLKMLDKRINRKLIRVSNKYFEEHKDKIVDLNMKIVEQRVGLNEYRIIIDTKEQYDFINKTKMNYFNFKKFRQRSLLYRSVTLNYDDFFNLIAYVFLYAVIYKEQIADKNKKIGNEQLFEKIFTFLGDENKNIGVLKNKFADLYLKNDSIGKGYFNESEDIFGLQEINLVEEFEDEEF